MARSLADIPIDIVIPTAFVCIVYWMVGLRATAFVQHLLSVLLVVLTSNSLGLLISALSNDLKQAQAFASVLTLALMLLGGFYLAVPAWALSWSRWVSFINQGYSLVVKVLGFAPAGDCALSDAKPSDASSQLQYPHDVSLPCDGGSGPALCSLRASPRFSGIEWAIQPGVHAGVLIAMIFALRIGTYVALRFNL